MKPFFSLLLPAMSLTAAVPPAEKKFVTDEYHGVEVAGEYRWLEESGSPAVKARTKAQNRHSRAWLDARADQAEIETKLTTLYAYGGSGHCMRPTFNFEHRLWADCGGIHVVGNIRWSGDHGEDLPEDRRPRLRL
jgi:prolyl oligopeptidase PreP (S9A serine peptidase family)